MLITTIPGVEAYRQACRRQPSLVQDNPSQLSIGLCGWHTGPTREIHIAKAEELVMSIHLGGARRVRIFTEEGLSRSFSKPGDVTLIPRGKYVSYRTEGEVEFATLHFFSNNLNDSSLDALARVQACLFAVPDHYIAASVRTLMQIAQTQKNGSKAYVAALFNALAYHIAHIVEKSDGAPGAPIVEPDQTERSPSFDKVIEQIDAQLAEKLTLNDLADIAGVSRTAFAEQFAKRFGCSPHKYIIQRRVERAKALLMEGRLSVTDIAYEVGFSGQSHLSTTFRAYTGCSPSAYQDKKVAQ